MEQRPQQPPEGRLVTAALERSGLSIREASKRAGISYGRWRQVASGIQHVSPGNYAAVHAPAKTVAKMALAVGVTPEQLETEGQRPDAAEALREMRQPEPAAPPPPPTRPEIGKPPAFLTEPERELALPVAARIFQRISDATGGGQDPALLAGADLFPDDPVLGAAWDAATLSRLPWWDAVWIAAAGYQRNAKAEERQRPGRNRTRGALVPSETNPIIT